jgi:hypothetical protein
MNEKKAKCCERIFDCALCIVTLTLLAYNGWAIYYMDEKVYNKRVLNSYYHSFKLWNYSYTLTSVFFFIGSIGLVSVMLAFSATIKRLDLESASIES